MTAIETSTQEVEAPRATLTALAWGAILIGGILPTIVLRLFLGRPPAEPLTPSWLNWAMLLVLTLLWAVTWLWPTVKPLRGFFLAVLAFHVGQGFIKPTVLNSEAWSNWVQQVSWGVALVSLLATSLIPAALMALTLIGSGIGRRELFLARGSPSAPAQPTRFLQGKEAIPWNHVMRRFLPFYVIIAVTVLGIQVRPDVSQISRALAFLPAIIIAAIINAFAEEFEFRSVLLARLEPVVGAQQAILMTAVMFGLQHYWGWPSGLIGVLLAGYLGWVAAKSMIETRGFVWAFSLHFIGDFIIYTFWAMGVSPGF